MKTMLLDGVKCGLRIFLCSAYKSKMYVKYILHFIRQVYINCIVYIWSLIVAYIEVAMNEFVAWCFMAILRVLEWMDVMIFTFVFITIAYYMLLTIHSFIYQKLKLYLRRIQPEKKDHKLKRTTIANLMTFRDIHTHTHTRGTRIMVPTYGNNWIQN